MVTPIHTLVTHVGVDADNLVSFFMLLEAGGKVYHPGISAAKIEFWGNGGDLSGKTADEWESEGFLLVDIGGGRLDHHQYPNNTLPTGEQVCSALLVARDLGIEDDPAWKDLLSWAMRDDLKGQGVVSSDHLDRALGLPALLAYASREQPENSARIMESVLFLLRPKFAEERRRAEDYVQEWERAEVIEIPYIDKKEKLSMTRVGFIESTLSGVVGYGKAKSGGGCDVVVRRNPDTGQVQIIPQHGGIYLGDVLAILRIEESRAMDVFKTFSLKETGEKALRQEGFLPGLNRWFYHRPTGSIQNGGPKAPDVIPTVLAWENIKTFVRIGMDQSIRTKDCSAPECQGCPAFAYRMVRCTKAKISARAQKK